MIACLCDRETLNDRGKDMWESIT
ncbi:hypothetical protein RSAG8_01911, partial [Rhizoctonia solani AG-8 WAC10335]